MQLPEIDLATAKHPPSSGIWGADANGDRFESALRTNRMPDPIAILGASHDPLSRLVDERGKPDH